jgi:hypothetical protein
MPLKTIRGKTKCPPRVSVSRRVGFDSHRLHQTSAVIADELGTSVFLQLLD